MPILFAFVVFFVLLYGFLGDHPSPVPVTGSNIEWSTAVCSTHSGVKTVAATLSDFDESDNKPQTVKVVCNDKVTIKKD